jgi:hypothetical protein
VGGTQLVSGVDASALAAQPFAVEEMGAGQFRMKAGAAQPVDCFVIDSCARITFVNSTP